MKKCVDFNGTSFGTLKYDCVINAIEILSFLPLINNSVTTGFNFTFLYWIVIFNVFVDILHIIRIFHKSFRIVKMI